MDGWDTVSSYNPEGEKFKQLTAPSYPRESADSFVVVFPLCLPFSFCGCYSTGGWYAETVRKREFQCHPVLFYTSFVARIKTSWGSFCVGDGGCPATANLYMDEKADIVCSVGLSAKEVWRPRDQQTATLYPVERLEKKFRTSSSHHFLKSSTRDLRTVQYI